MFKNLKKNLNKNQKDAVINTNGPCLIVAGAGSGKTKVLTSRVVHIIKETFLKGAKKRMYYINDPSREACFYPSMLH